MMDKKYFGTDGIRGRVGEPPISADFMLKLGWAVGRVLSETGRKRVLIGKDTRISGYMFESALEAGLSAAGVDIHLLGPMPTPAIAYLTKTLHASAGIVISASHNPHYDNGIKFFASDGAKLDDATENAIEAEMDKPLKTVESHLLGKATRMLDAGGRYIEFCKHSIDAGIDLGGMTLVADCANGATYQVAPAVLQELGARVIRNGTEPDGLNINVDSGSTHPERAAALVVQHGAHAGIALDGDGDRVIMIDETGAVVDGDEILFIIARARQQRGLLRGPVVGTVMSNLGLEKALESLDVVFCRAKVGDRYVLEMLKDRGGVLGGESSGHVVCLDRTSTGDGIVSALQVLELMAHTGQRLSELRSGMTKYPQHMINVPLSSKCDVLSLPGVREAVSETERELGDSGRILLRPSGTEPVVRVMVEGADRNKVEQLAEYLATAVGTAVAGIQPATAN